MKRARPILRLALVGESADSFVAFKVAELTHRCLAAISKLREELDFIFREQPIQSCRAQPKHLGFGEQPKTIPIFHLCLRHMRLAPLEPGHKSTSAFGHQRLAATNSTEPQLQQLIQRVWLSFATQRLFGRFVWLEPLDELFSEDG